MIAEVSHWFLYKVPLLVRREAVELGVNKYLPEQTPKKIDYHNIHKPCNCAM
jgi:hypothetical protein